MKIPALLSFLFLIAGNFKEEVDLIVHNANIYTMDEGFSKASRLAVKDRKFIAISEDGDLAEQFTAKRQIDAQGKAIVPRLIYAHCYFMIWE